MTPPATQHLHDHNSPHKHASQPKARPTLSLLAWPAWKRMLVVLPLVLCLWLAVWWANMGTNPW